MEELQMSNEEPPPASLAELIDLDVEPRRVWRRDELGALLLHELSLPVSVAMGELTLTCGERSAGLRRPAGPAPADAEGTRLVTMGALLHHPASPLELIEQVKNAAKAARHDACGHLPEDVAAVLYSLAIAAALLVHGRRITSMSDGALRDHFAWALGREWLDPGSRRLLGQALVRLSEGPHSQELSPA